MNDLTVKAHIREAAMELFAELGYAKEVGLRERMGPSSGFQQAQRWGPRTDTSFPVLTRVPPSSAA